MLHQLDVHELDEISQFVEIEQLEDPGWLVMRLFFRRQQAILLDLGRKCRKARTGLEAVLHSSKVCLMTQHSTRDKLHKGPCHPLPTSSKLLMRFRCD